MFTTTSWRMSPTSDPLGLGVPKLGMWYKSTEIPNTNGQKIAYWPDRSNRDAHATQSVVVNQPILYTNQRNGYPAARFSSSFFTMKGHSFVSGSAIFIVANPSASLNSGNSRAGNFVGGAAGGNDYQAGDSWAMNMGDNLTKPVGIHTYWRGVGSGGTPATLDLSKWGLYAMTTSASGANIISTARLNSVQSASWSWTNAASPGVTTTLNVIGARVLGGAPALNTTQFWGDIAEILVFTGSLSPAQITTVENYLNAKYTLY